MIAMPMKRTKEIWTRILKVSLKGMKMRQKVNLMMLSSRLELRKSAKTIACRRKLSWTCFSTRKSAELVNWTSNSLRSRSANSLGLSSESSNFA